MIINIILYIYCIVMIYKISSHLIHSLKTLNNSVVPLQGKPTERVIL